MGSRLYNMMMKMMTSICILYYENIVLVPVIGILKVDGLTDVMYYLFREMLANCDDGHGYFDSNLFMQKYIEVAMVMMMLMVKMMMMMMNMNEDNKFHLNQAIKEKTSCYQWR